MFMLLLLEESLLVLEEAVSARFRSVSYLHTRGPGLAGHLAALQHGVMADLNTVRHLLEHCVPPHYELTGAYLRAGHRCLHAHLAQRFNVTLNISLVQSDETY
ncbi:Exocyst complex component 3-like protein [Liparis tanakae]|uniref:Exocyst complex component 3-like protein n=1 Tax=Liparis tanakae TaxID=230148 RepID=A0A4Z2F3R6_9TELE|nr:Exocyst complex component 3-like protein [Liparis tanakae]